MEKTVYIDERFRGPPRSGNGGYVTGLVARLAGGHRAVYLRAPAPLDVPLRFESSSDSARLTHDGKVIAEAVKSDSSALPEVPAPPSLEQARAAGRHAACSHPTCYCCGDKVAPTEGLHVQTGQVSELPPGFVAGVWKVDAAAIGGDGCLQAEHIWSAIDCPGSYAWLAKDGINGGLTAMMQAEVLESPRVGDECIILAWPLDQLSDRRRTSGVALFDRDGRLLARAIQLWVRPNRLEGPTPQ